MSLAVGPSPASLRSPGSTRAGRGCYNFETPIKSVERLLIFSSVVGRASQHDFFLTGPWDAVAGVDLPPYRNPSRFFSFPHFLL